LCRAISADFAGDAVPLRAIVQARTKRRHELLTILKNRHKAVDILISLKRGRTPEEVPASSPFQKSPRPQSSSATATSSDESFVETWLCFGPPGVGKTLSAIRYSRNEIIGKIDPWTAELSIEPLLDTVLYTPSVINFPSRIGCHAVSHSECRTN
jgi:hypothetical protein